MDGVGGLASLLFLLISVIGLLAIYLVVKIGQEILKWVGDTVAKLKSNAIKSCSWKGVIIGLVIGLFLLLILYFGSFWTGTREELHLARTLISFICFGGFWGWVLTKVAKKEEKHTRTAIIMIILGGFFGWVYLLFVFIFEGLLIALFIRNRVEDIINFHEDGEALTGSIAVNLVGCALWTIVRNAGIGWTVAAIILGPIAGAVPIANFIVPVIAAGYMTEPILKSVTDNVTLQPFVLLSSLAVLGYVVGGTIGERSIEIEERTAKFRVKLDEWKAKGHDLSDLLKLDGLLKTKNLSEVKRRLKRENKSIFKRLVEINIGISKLKNQKESIQEESTNLISEKDTLGERISQLIASDPANLSIKVREWKEQVQNLSEEGFHEEIKGLERDLKETKRKESQLEKENEEICSQYQFIEHKLQTIKARDISNIQILLRDLEEKWRKLSLSELIKVPAEGKLKSLYKEKLVLEMKINNLQQQLMETDMSQKLTLIKMLVLEKEKVDRTLRTRYPMLSEIDHELRRLEEEGYNLGTKKRMMLSILSELQ